MQASLLLVDWTSYSIHYHTVVAIFATCFSIHKMHCILSILYVYVYIRFSELVGPCSWDLIICNIGRGFFLYVILINIMLQSVSAQFQMQGKCNRNVRDRYLYIHSRNSQHFKVHYSVHKSLQRSLS